MSTIIATDLQAVKKTLLKNNATRWNSIYIMIKSYNKLTFDEVSGLIKHLKVQEQRTFTLSPAQRTMAVELENMLEELLFASKEFQSNSVTSSIVFPAITYLKTSLIKDLANYKHTKELRRQIVKNLCIRFGPLLNNEVFLFATFLDPHYGPLAFPKHTREQVIERLKYHILRQNNVNVLNQNLHTNKDHGKNVFRDRFTRFDDEDNSDQTASSLREKNVENLINDYMMDINTFPLTKEVSVLSFWREKQHRWEALAKVAKKVLGVPASSSAVERMFSIAGHIFSSKRRRMKPRIFEQLVFCKLNENLL